MNNCRISIIVCTYNRSEILPFCLESLVDQTLGTEWYEVIIVDNNSTDSTQGIACQYAETYKNFIYVKEPNQGLSHARNLGWNKAKTEWTVFLDDDAKASPNFVERIISVIGKYDFECFGGVYLPWYRYGKPKWFRDEYASNGKKIDHVGILDKGSASGGVIVFKKSLLEKFGGFPTHIGMIGTTISYGEESYLQNKMKEKGYKIGFDPELIVYHLVPRYKMHPLWFIKSNYARGRDSCIASAEPITWGKIFRTAKTLLYDLAYYSIICTPRLLKQEYYLQNWIMDIFRPFAWHIGIIKSSLHTKLSDEKK